MPATLGHIGIQYLMTKACLPKADVKWILAGCLVPDVPWVMQRAVAELTNAPLIEVRLYAIAQSTLLMSLVLCAFLAFFGRKFWYVFAVLAFGTVLHLGLDALQTKWANGVVLLAPLRWDLLNFGMFWPEDWQTYALHGLSVAVGIWVWVNHPRSGKDLQFPGGWRASIAGLLLITYAALPVFMKDGARASNLHYSATLHDIENRIEKPIEFDRNSLSSRSDGTSLKAWTGEEFQLIGPMRFQGKTASIRGQFETSTTIRVADFHIHTSGVRDAASYIGLLVIFLWWVSCIVDRRRV